MIGATDNEKYYADAKKCSAKNIATAFQCFHVVVAKKYYKWHKEEFSTESRQFNYLLLGQKNQFTLLVFD